jgi:hypothetical protein
MKYKINSTGNVIVADKAFVDAHYAGDYTLLPDDPSPVATTVRTLTHLGFRELFTQTEQEWADELEATFESNALLTPEQKRSLRTGYKNFNLATEVDLDDPRIPPMLGLYVALGGLDAGRVSEILA